MTSRRRAYGVVLVVGLATASALAQPDRQTVTGAPGGVTAGTITGGTFNFPGLSEADRAEMERRHKELLVAIAREKGVPYATLQALLVRMGEAGVPQEAVEARLRAKADEYVSLRAELARRLSDWHTEAARAKAQMLLERGDLGSARAVLVEERGRLRARHEQTTREEAYLAAEEARVARLASHYREAAALYKEAARLLAFDTPAAWVRTVNAADALYDQDNESDDNAALREALATYGEAFALAPRAERPDAWVATQAKLGRALFVLGVRESGTARLEEALAVYRAASQELTRERVRFPFQWAFAQHGLANALATLARRERREGAVHTMEEAIVHMRSAVQAFQQAADL